ncbi:MAG: hypothetical protein HUK23_08105 [Sphaerochaetaceae bacterium]|nr:hypothetical protein [Sphaerochaetaceae bacterium]
MFKVNGGITIKRSGSSASEIKEQTLKVSRYIRYCIEEKKRSVWIAQKSGRSKDGIDNTSSAIIKMLYLAYREDGISFDEFIKRSSICPIAISYQYDPCDVTKSEEQIRKLKAEGCYNVYKKKKYADVLDLVRGMRMNKGNVHLQIGTPLDSATITDALKATREIDRQIHTGYRLWDTNYYAFDKVNGTNIYADKYKDMNTKAFDKHCKYLKEDVKQYLYQSYANPVVSMRMEEELNEAK